MSTASTRSARKTLLPLLIVSLFPLCAWGQVKTTFKGFVDTSFFYESVQNVSTFSLDQVELDIDSQLTPWAGLRFDINFLADPEVTLDGVGGRALAFDDLSTDDVLEQGYITLTLPTKNLGIEATLRFGKFNTPIGWELLDPVDRYQFSFAHVFNYGLPFNTTGALIALKFNPIVDLQLYAVNGWDQLQDNNDNKTFGGRLGITPVEDLNWGLSFIIGPEQDDNDDDYRTVFDTDLTIKLIPKLLIGADFSYGFEENAGAGGRDAKWLAGLLTLHYSFTDIIGLTLRFDAFDDKDGARLPNDNPAVTDQTTYSFTLAPVFNLGKGIRALAELRYIKSNEDVFLKRNGGFTDESFVVALEFTYSFEHAFEVLVK